MSKPRSGAGHGGRDRRRQHEAVECDRAAAAPLREDVLAEPEALEPQALAEPGDLEDARPGARRLPAIELVEVTLGDLQPDPGLAAGASAAGGHACTSRHERRRGRLVGARAPARRAGTRRRPPGCPRPARTAPSSLLWRPGGVTTKSSTPCSIQRWISSTRLPIFAMTSGSANARSVRAHDPLAVEVGHALVRDRRVEAALQLDRVGVAAEALARLAEQRHHLGQFRRLDAEVEDVGVLGGEREGHLRSAAGDHDLDPRPSNAPRLVVEVLDARVLALERERRLVVVQCAGHDLEVLASGSRAARRGSGSRSRRCRPRSGGSPRRGRGRRGLP